ncbi:MAG TPA: hypothetical protein VKB56_08880 [Terriglobales bacterium]|nr:hypothetical protein [Terriglobales bacterium]
MFPALGLQFATIKAGRYWGQRRFRGGEPTKTGFAASCAVIRNFEMPDPEQVDRDLDQAEKRNKKDEKGKNAP